jgi:two-component system LytT family response regulator
MKVLIIDNDSSIREGLKNLINKFCPQVLSINEANGVVEGIKLIKDIKPDLVFLDVEMDDGTGFDLVQQLGEYNFQLVFITAHNKYAINAFKFCAIDFLLKPIDPSDLALSVNKAIAQIKNKNLEQQVNLLKEIIQNSGTNKPAEKKIALNDGNIIHYIKIDDIVYCKADGSYTVFQIVGSQKIMVSRILKEYDDLLTEYGFIRTHHSFLVNAKKIAKFDRSDGGQLFLDENHTVPVSTRKKEIVLELLSKL